MTAVTKRISSSYKPQFQTSCELVWAKLSINHCKSIYVGHATEHTILITIQLSNLKFHLAN